MIHKKREEVEVPHYIRNIGMMVGAPLIGSLLGPIGAPIGLLTFAAGALETATWLEGKLTRPTHVAHISKESISEIFRLAGVKNLDQDGVKVTVIDTFENYTDVYLKAPMGMNVKTLEEKIGILSTYYRNRCFIIPESERRTNQFYIDEEEEEENNKKIKKWYEKQTKEERREAREKEKERKKRFPKPDPLRNGFGVVPIRIYTTVLKDFIPFKHIGIEEKERLHSLVFYYGKSRDGWEKVDLSEGHCLIAGETASGKSVLLHVILLQLMLNYTPEQLEIQICDFKEGVEFNVYENCQHVTYYSTDYSPDSVKAYLDGLFQEMSERNQLFHTIPGVTKISEYNAKCAPEKRIPRKIVVMEEMVTLMDSKEVKEMFGRLSALARNAGIHIIGTTQRPSKDVISSLLKCNMAIRFGLLTADANNSRIIIDVEGCEQLKGKGNGLLKNGSKINEFQAMYISNENIHALLHYMEKGPRFNRLDWRSGTYPTLEGDNLQSLFDEHEDGENMDDTTESSFFDQLV